MDLRKWILMCLFFSCCFLAKAQQSRIDTIVSYIKGSKTSNGVDTVKFFEALDMVRRSQLSDPDIALIEKVSDSIYLASDIDLCFYAKQSIFQMLNSTDKDRAISYGRLQCEQLEKIQLPVAAYIRSQFTKSLRLPYRNSNRLNDGFKYFNEKLIDYKQKNDSIGLADCYYVLAGFYQITGLLDQAIYNLKKSLSYTDTIAGNENRIGLFEKPNSRSMWLNNLAVLGFYYLQNEDYESALKFSHEALSTKLRQDKNGSYPFDASNIALATLMSGRSDSVEYYLDMAISAAERAKSSTNLVCAYQVQSLYKLETGDLDGAERILQESWRLIEENNIPLNPPSGTVAPDYYLALVRIRQNRIEEAIDLLKRDIIRLNNQRLDKLRDYKLLAELYESTRNYEMASETYRTFIDLQDSLHTDQRKYQSLSFETEQLMNENETALLKLKSENKINSLTRNFFLGIVVLLMFIVVGIYMRFRSKKEANAILEQSYNELKRTQAQLVQSEKLASLGALTAGIAHEIQNPLNFINNFSELNSELIAELKEEMDKGHLEEAKKLSADIDENEQRILQHGKRADAIVKGMLQHSRSSSGKKEPTDINALTDEYLRLAYHGLRAKDKSFNAKMETNFDDTIGLINAIPQELGRVILNLITNAFYVVNEKKKSGTENYDPKVSVSTKKFGDKMEIRVKDNGDGISADILDKIFQPFFTTKPTGQGTGLGLSMSYDIVTKGHGGELSVETEVGVGTTFVVQLPVGRL